jgi:lysophospholipase L1-like esterase
MVGNYKKVFLKLMTWIILLIDGDMRFLLRVLYTSFRQAPWHPDNVIQEFVVTAMKIAFWGDSLTAGQPGSSYYDRLTQWLPAHTLANYGKGGDTVISLHKRLLRMEPLGPVDMAFLWIGTNDVLLGVSFSLRVIGLLRRLPTSRDNAEFNSHYQSILGILSQSAGVVVAVPPILIGEDLDNRWNQQLAALAQSIEELTPLYHNVTYLDLRTVFVSRLAQKQPSQYIPLSAIQIARDGLTLKTSAQIDRQADKRGLHVTLDGVHLNSVGADMVANQFMDAISGAGG